jgi:hypothetical protein
MIVNPTTTLHLERRRVIHNIGHGGHTLLPHNGIGCTHSSLALLGGKVVPYLTYGTCETRKTRTRGYSPAKVRQLDVGMSIDHSGTQRTSEKFGMRQRIQTLPLLHTHNLPLVIHRDDGTLNNLTSIDKVVCRYVSKITHPAF